MKKQELLEKLKGKLIVSCQARVGWAMYGVDIMAAFAKAAEEGGAAGIRATGVDNITAIKQRVNLPIIGINKIFDDNYDVYITPTYQSAKDILDTGIEIIALDATPRKRPNNETFDEIVAKIRENYPDVLIMAEISTFEEAQAVIKKDIDIISTTLSGYTKESQNVKTVNIDLVRKISEACDIPVIAEGKIQTPEDMVAVLQAGAHCAVVGTAITRPEIITSRFVAQLPKE